MSWNDTIIAEFRDNDGKVGGRFEGALLLLLHTTGAQPGAARVSPVIDATAEPVVGERRDILFARFAERSPGFAAYQEKTDRVIPIVELTPAANGRGSTPDA